jgi:hypothetical protein
MRNVHQRRFPVPAAKAAPLLDRLASPDDVLWPDDSWPKMRLDRPLGVGAAGGHGPIRYSVTAYEPGRRVEFTFAPEMRFSGTHTLSIEDGVEPAGEGACVIRHVLVGRARGRMRLGWPLVIRWLHDACLEDLLDNAEEALTGRVAAPARWSWWVRFLRARMGSRRRRPASARGAQRGQATALPGR